MPVHINHLEADPTAYKALLGVSQYLATTEISKGLQHLIFIRASQINRCAYCLDMHFHDARKHGETHQRLDTIAAWRDTPFFTPAERAALALTEYVTRISDVGVPDELEAELRAYYSEKQILQLLMAIIVINGWNRLMVTTGGQPALRA
jgi:AhpD family alkylhydroperoxidase